jgi:lipopolysaccharide export system protein LptA
MEYFREKEGLRSLPYWIATGRPFMRMSPTESGAAPGTQGDSLDLTANRIYSLNDSLVWASGRVVIERSDMRATADSATLDNGIEFARLLRDPKINGKGERAFTLVGVEIDMWSKDRALDRVLSSGDAKATTDSLLLTSDTIDLRIVDQQMERVYTWGGRSRAVSAQQDIESDSMDIRMPAQKLERVHAIGRAIAYSVVDTAKVISSERDWIAGDTIDAQFETVEGPADSVATDTTGASSKTRMREVTASGAARAFYQLPPSGGVRGAPNLSYNRGRMITVHFVDGEMATVTVSEQASGLYLEPTPTAATAASPTAPARERKP